MEHVKVRAYVRLTIDVDVSDTWGGDCPMSQVTAQAVDAAKARIRKGLFNIAVVGEPEVTTVITTSGEVMREQG